MKPWDHMISLVNPIKYWRDYYNPTQMLLEKRGRQNTSSHFWRPALCSPKLKHKSENDITDAKRSNKVTIKIKLQNNTLINVDAVIHRKLSKLNQEKILKIHVSFPVEFNPRIWTLIIIKHCWEKFKRTSGSNLRHPGIVNANI